MADGEWPCQGWPRRRTLAIVAGVVLVATAGWALPLGAWVRALAEGARDAGPLGVALFVVVYVASTVAAVPGSLLTLAIGFAYGPVWGVAVASPASVAGATCAFLLGRTLLRDWAESRVRGSPYARAIEAGVEREGFTLVLLLRLSPVVPFNALNYLLSLTRVRPGTYVLASAIGMLPGTALYVYLGSLAPAAAALGSMRDAGTPGTWLYGVGLLATVAAVVVAGRAARRALARELTKGPG